jgi:hypothetical protein
MKIGRVPVAAAGHIVPEIPCGIVLAYRTAKRGERE